MPNELTLPDRPRRRGNNDPFRGKAPHDPPYPKPLLYVNNKQYKPVILLVPKLLFPA